MKLIFSLCLILLCINGLIVSTTDKCTCTQLASQSDCNQMSTCNWDSTNKKCIAATTTPTTTVVYYSQLCSSITDGPTCAKTIGCAYVNKKCEPFSGCISFSATSNSDCQKYSLKCNWSPTKKYCLEEPICEEYKGAENQSLCESVLQKDGTKWCQFTENNCSKLTCEQFKKKTDDECKKVLSDTVCITDKFECVTSLKTCETYTTKLEQCLEVTAINFLPCEKSSDGTKCQARTCAGATSQYQSADKCKEYKSTCVYNGKACADALLSCDKYTPTPIDDCQYYIGTQGLCLVPTDATQTKCVIPTCDSYSKTTDAECKTANTTLSCITNGIKCVSALDTCSNTTVPTGDKCDSVIAKDGKCQQDGTTGKCQVATCISQKQATNEACAPYSTTDVVCVSNGVNCITQLTCKEYTISSEANSPVCDFFIGSDGKCITDTTATNKCTVQACADIAAPTSLADCVKGNSTCKFDGKACVTALKACSEYTADCDKVISSSGSCALDAATSKCVNKTCSTAPNTTKTNEDCKAYLSTCITNGYGCVTELKACSTYTGVQSVCEQYIGSDGKCTGGAISGVCTPKDCSTSTATTDDTCKSFSSTCLYNPKIKKCDKFIPKCSDIVKDEATCIAQFTSEIGGNCKWVADSLVKCNPATCNDIQSGSTEICAKFSTTCTFDGIGCYDKNNYGCANVKSKSDCKTDSSGNACIWNTSTSKCFQFNKCEDYTFTVTKDATTGIVVVKSSSDIQKESITCKEISSLCYSNGTTCVPYQPCGVIPQETCAQSVGPDLKACGWDGSAKPAICKIFGACKDLKLLTHADCQAYSNTCTSNGTECTEWGACKEITDQSACSSIGGKDGKCTWDTTAKTCRAWVCTDDTKITYKDCQLSSPQCASDGKTCIPLTNCANYNQDSCVQGTDNNTTSTCVYDSKVTPPVCRVKGCADYTSVTGAANCTSINCAYNSTGAACMDKTVCTDYPTSDVCNGNNDLKTNKTCIWLTTTAVNGTSSCKEFSACADAHSNETICAGQSNCYYVKAVTNTTANTTTEAQCKTVSDCTSYNTKIASNSTSGCKPYISGTKLTFCQIKNGTSECIEGDANSLGQTQCFQLSQYTYIWNTQQSKCVSCTATATSNTTNQTNTTNNTNGTNTTTNSYSGIITAILFVILIQ